MSESDQHRVDESPGGEEFGPFTGTGGGHVWVGSGGVAPAGSLRRRQSCIGATAEAGMKTLLSVGSSNIPWSSYA